MIRKAFWAAGLGLLAIGVAGAVALDVPEAEAQTTTKTLHLRVANQGSEIKRVTLFDVRLDVASTSTSTKYSVFLQGDLAECTIEVPSLQDAATLRGQITNGATRDVYCAGDRITASDPNTGIVAVKVGTAGHSLQVRGRS